MKRKTKDPHFPPDTKLWENVITSQQVQALAWKIERATQADAEKHEIAKMLVEKWAELVNVRRYFPNLQNVFTPEAVFCIVYAHRCETEGVPRYGHPALRVQEVLGYISNLNRST